MDLTKQFFKYVSQNIFGLLGTSCYILADTYFIAQAVQKLRAGLPGQLDAQQVAAVLRGQGERGAA